MTLCIVWKDAEKIHFCSDSRVTVGPNSFADVGVKVLCLPVRIYSPRGENETRSLDHDSEIGMCFAGSSVNSLLIKESLAELLKELQYAPGHTDMSMFGLATFMFTAYRRISGSLFSTMMGAWAHAEIVIAGRCPRDNELLAFLFETDASNQPHMRKILTNVGEFELIGSGKGRARSLLSERSRGTDFLAALREVIRDPQIDTVGGPIQYGTFEGDKFRCYGVAEFDGSAVRYWRAGLDFNSADFMSGYGNFIPGFRMLSLEDESDGTE